MIVRSTALAAGLVVALAAPAVAGPKPTLNAGVVSQGQTNLHHYDNNPSGGDCVHLAQPYRVTISYAPASDTLTLSAGGQTAVGSNGGASVFFVSGVCTSFDVAVTGTAVADKAAYVINVYSGPLAYEWSAVA